MRPPLFPLTSPKRLLIPDLRPNPARAAWARALGGAARCPFFAGLVWMMIKPESLQLRTLEDAAAVRGERADQPINGHQIRLEVVFVLIAVI